MVSFHHPMDSFRAQTSSFLLWIVVSRTLTMVSQIYQTASRADSWIRCLEALWMDPGLPITRPVHGGENRQQCFRTYIWFYYLMLAYLLYLFCTVIFLYIINCWLYIWVTFYKGLGSLTNNFCPANFEKKSFYKEHQNVSMIPKYNLFTVNKWIFKTPKSILYKKNLTFSYVLLSK